MTGGASQGLRQTPPLFHSLSIQEHASGVISWRHCPQGRQHSWAVCYNMSRAWGGHFSRGQHPERRQRHLGMASRDQRVDISLLALISFLPCTTGMSNHETFLRVDAGYRMPCPLECPPNIYKLMLSCWSRDPKQRPCFKDLCEKLTGITRYENLV